MKHPYATFGQQVWKQYRKHSLGIAALIVLFLFLIAGIYAPLLASSKPLVVQYQGNWYFPLFRYLFFPSFFTKRLDIFYNLLMFTFPLFLISGIFLKRKIRFITLLSLTGLQLALFLFLIFNPPLDPASDSHLNEKRNVFLNENPASFNWSDELQFLTPYAQLNLALKYRHYLAQHQRLIKFENDYKERSIRLGQNAPFFPSLWNLFFKNHYETGTKEWLFFDERDKWLNQQQSQIKYLILPFFRTFHWEDDAGGDQGLNHLINWQDLTRINRKDLMAALLFGIRISLSVGFLAIGLALLIGIPLGALAGYYGGKFDLITYRLIEIWEAMPIFFMLLMVVAFFQSKSIFLIIGIIGLFGWTGFSRFIRGEFFRQKQMLYIEACRALGYSDSKIIFSHILPNAIPPLLTLVPFAIMGAIASEAGLSFLGLGEEGSNSWGVLMDEGRTAFPSESYLLWPPAFLLSLLLVSIALVGDSLRDALDPKLHIH